MSTKHKYIRHSQIGFIIFPDMTNVFHRHVAELVIKFQRGAIISAGFVRFDTTEGADLVCYGESESLGIKSKPDDTEEMKKQLFS